MATRKIVVRGARYQWSVIDAHAHDGLRVAVRREETRRGSRLIAAFATGNLVTPYLVRQAIERALDEGWDPASTVHASVGFDDVQPDRPGETTAPAPVDAIEGALLERIADADRDDDDGDVETARLIYADWLLDQGDPQGELIALACAAAVRPLQPGEMRRLGELEALREGWLGPVAAVAPWRAWHRGMLDECTLGRWHAGVVDAALGARAWRTVRTIDARRGMLATSDVHRLVTQPELRALRRLLVPGAVAAALARGGTSFARVTELAIGDELGGAATLELLAALCARAPALRTLSIPPVTQAGLAQALRASTAATLVVRDGGFSLAGSAARVLAASAPAGLRVLACAAAWHGFRAPGPTLAWSRGPDGGWSALAVTWRGAYQAHLEALLLAALALLPPRSLRTVRVDLELAGPAAPAALAGAIDAALARGTVS